MLRSFLYCSWVLYAWFFLPKWAIFLSVIVLVVFLVGRISQRYIRKLDELLEQDARKEYLASLNPKWGAAKDDAP